MFSPQKGYMAYNTKYWVNEARHSLTHKMRKTQSVLGRHFAKAITSMGAGLAGLSSGGTYYIAGLAGMGVGIFFKARENQLEYEHAVQQLATYYKEEIHAMRMAKGLALENEPKRYSEQEIQWLATQNTGFKEQLEREEKYRNLSTMNWVAGAALAFIVAGSVGAAVGVASAPAILAGFVAFQAVKRYGEPILKRIFGVDEPTTVEIAQGLDLQRSKFKTISHAQVMEAFVAARPDLQESIKKEYGKPLMELGPREQQKIIIEFQEVDIPAVALAINEYRLNPRELAFMVHGMASGAKVDQAPRQYLNAKAAHLRDRTQHYGQQFRQGVNNFVKKRGSSAGEAAADHHPAPQEAVEEESYAWRNKVNRENTRGSQQRDYSFGGV